MARASGTEEAALVIKKPEHSRRPHKRVAVAGNPNVGKSTIFNALTGMKQHTGNWPGKTVLNAQGYCVSQRFTYTLVDIPGAYSLMAHSPEEAVARDFICFDQPDAVIVVCDATCLVRNMNLVLQTMELSGRVLLCVNLLDEAERKGIKVDLQRLEKRLGIKVVGTVARDKRTLKALMSALDDLLTAPEKERLSLPYPPPIEKAVARLTPVLQSKLKDCPCRRWLSIRLMDADTDLLEQIEKHTGLSLQTDIALQKAVQDARETLEKDGLDPNALKDALVTALMGEAERLCEGCVTGGACGSYASRDRRLDRILTGPKTGYPVMLMLLSLVLWLTLAGANIPSALLSDALFSLQDGLSALFIRLGAPDWLHSLCVLGVYRVLAWVVSVMLPPMAIFFPLFTLLEDLGYLPRIAYNLDHSFQKCRACGKQALCMCMGLGCNAVGVMGCRIIDSPRERLIAILTNSLTPCNGRFPTLALLLAMFLTPLGGGAFSGLLSAILLMALIVLSVSVTFAASKFLSQTLLKGVPSSFTLELPPYRRPQIGKVLVRSLFDRTLFVLGRAAAVAAPAGLLIWLMANVTVAQGTLLSYGVRFLDPFARLMGLDGAILMAFILAFPANEIMLPILLMTYLAQGSLLEMSSMIEIKALLTANGWTLTTAVCSLWFTLVHWPCSTTLITVYKETGSAKWTAVALALPAGIGVIGCMILAFILRLF